MQKLLMVFLSMIAYFMMSAQTIKWDSTHRPNNYVIKVEQFRSYTDQNSDIVFLGNSITAGTDWNELMNLSTARNRGISGDITFGILERLDEVTAGKPSKIFVLIGINDIARNIPDSVILENYLRIIRRIKKESPGTKIYFQTLMPVNNEFTPSKNHYNKDEHTQAVNEGLKKIGQSEGITVIDLHPHFLDSNNKLDKSLTMDGLHLNAAGYKKWAGILKPFFK